MKLGLALPTYGSDASPEAIVAAAQGAEHIGLATVWTFERLLRPVEPVSFGSGPPMSLPDAYASVFDPLDTLAYVAARTSRVKLGTSVIDALFHPPVVLGRRFATLDQVSGGRVVAGLGQGWMAAEFAAAGVPPRRKGAGYSEYIEALRAVWGPDPVRFEGRFYEIAESQLGPKPVQPGGPPIISGSVSKAGVERAARAGVGLNPIIFDWGSLRQTVAAFRSAAAAAGHDPAALPVVIRVNGSITDKPLDDRGPLVGSAEQVADDLGRLEAIEVDDVFWSMDTDAADHIPAMEGLLAAL